MAGTAVPEFRIPQVPPQQNDASYPSSSTLWVLDASDEKCAFIFPCPVAGDLEAVGWMCATITCTSATTLRVSFQDLDASGLPDGTADQYRTQTGDTVASAGWNTTGLITSDGTDGGTKRTVTAGQMIAVVFDFTAFNAGESVRPMGTQFRASMRPANVYTASSPPAGSWTKDSSLNMPYMALRYATSTYYCVHSSVYPATLMSSTTYSSSSTPDEMGLYFTPSVTIDCSGAWLYADTDNAVDAVLYDSDGSSVLASYSFATAARADANPRPLIARWTAVTLSAGSAYRLTLKPTTTSNVSLGWWTADSSTQMPAADAGANWYWTQRTDGGSWTQTDSKRPWMGLFINGITVGSGGGVIGGPNMRAGMMA